MKAPELSAREMQESDIELIADYWTTADPDFLKGLGVDLSKMPQRAVFVNMLQHQFCLPMEQKRAYVTIWELDGKAIGHCNLNPMTFGGDAHMHLHIWNVNNRKKGMGAALVKSSVDLFFKNIQLQNLFSEPYALNDAPNKTLEKAGFEFQKEYVTVPGSINFEQPVKQWLLTREKWKLINK